jgi:hypothetical protein
MRFGKDWPIPPWNKDDTPLSPGTTFVVAPIGLNADKALSKGKLFHTA